ncbi:hypothetical protein KGY79_13475 [Candidatus Bipolaricaulota bacterium]|nr:hypothetical protein [Candidatus Bipolaricaulota bacterium]
MKPSDPAKITAEESEYENCIYIENNDGGIVLGIVADGQANEAYFKEPDQLLQWIVDMWNIKTDWGDQKC